MRTLLVVSAGLSNPSSTTKVGLSIAHAVAAQVEDLEVATIELRDLAVDLAQYMTGGDEPSAALKEALDQLENAAGLVAISPVFKASYSGVFKMFFDAADPLAIQATPVVVAATAGSARHSLMLEHSMRPLFSFLKAQVMPTAVLAAREDFDSDKAVLLDQRIDRAAKELAQALNRRC